MSPGHADKEPQSNPIKLGQVLKTPLGRKINRK